ncbi:MAG: HEAT repeat domain-containing protein [Burkholderiales bacterium]
MRATGLAALFLPVLIASHCLPAAADEIEKLRAEWREDSLRDLERGDAAEQIRAAKSLDVAFAAKTAPVLARHLSHADAAIRLSAASALWTLAGKSATAFEAARPALRTALDDTDGAVAMNAAGALSAMKEPAEALAPARRRVLQSPGNRAYVGFLAARGLIGIDPPASLAPALLAYLEESTAAVKRGGSRDNVQLARRALERLVDTKDRAILEPIRDQLRITRGAAAVLLPVLHRFSPRPDDWTAVLLDHTESADRDVAYAAWTLLGEQSDPASLARWTPRAAAALAVDARRDDAMRALGSVAGRTATGLKELAAVAANPAASEEQQLRAIEILGKAADSRISEHPPEVSGPARALWLSTCEPELKGGKPGKRLDQCLRPSSAAWVDDKERARHLASWLAANPDPAVKVELLGRLEGLWSKAFDETDTVRAELAHADPRVKQAAEKALDRIRPAWRESGARQARQAAAPAPKAAPATAGSGPGADGAALYGAIRVGDVAKVKALVTRANVLQPVRFPQVKNPPLPLVVAVNYCGIPTVAPAQLAEIVAHIVSLGADPEMKDAQGENLFDRAKYVCPPEVMKALGG